MKSWIRSSGRRHICRAWTPSAAARRACTSTTACGWPRFSAACRRMCSSSGCATFSSRLKRAWGGMPFEVVNDGEVTALAGSMSLGKTRVLGIAMGTSLAAGYVTPEGNITSWLNELAFAPVDYNPHAPLDEWSGDRGCGVQYFSQQCVGRLSAGRRHRAPAACPCRRNSSTSRNLMEQGDQRARENLSDHRRLFRLRRRPLRRVLRFQTRPRPGARHLRPRRRRDYPPRQGGLAGGIPRTSPPASPSTSPTKKTNATARPSPLPASLLFW